MMLITSSPGEQLRFIIRGHTPFPVTSRSMYRRPWVAQEARPQESHQVIFSVKTDSPSPKYCERLIIDTGSVKCAG